MLRGMGNQDKRITIRQNIGNSDPDILCLQETKIQLMSDLLVKNVSGFRSCGWHAFPS